MLTIELPPHFYFDHVARGLPAGTVIREKAKTIVVELEMDELLEILDDAQHYASAPAGYWEGVSFGLLASARATAKRITRLLAEQGQAIPKSSHERAAQIESRRYRFANPEEGTYPRTIETTATSEEQARRKIKADLPRTADWPLVQS